ncbi:D-alanine--D-alanine ligase [Candidatus Saccharibacteria bacterium]|nr:D-alanine--D-alanine ligase [Candidatus Saccharibacteria bacterium]
MSERIGVIFGGRSTEHDISIVSAIANVVKPLKVAGKEVLPIYIDKKGVWRAGEEFGIIENYRLANFSRLLEKNKPVAVDINDGLKIVFSAKGALAKPRVVKIDMVFPVMHGTNGEDGSLMGLLQMADVPFVGCRMEASAVAMNKILAKEVAVANNIPTSKFLHYTSSRFRGEPEVVIEEILEKLELPLFVKPAHLGSSIGITRVDKREDLGNAIDVAAYYDDRVIVEEAVQNLIEVTVPIIGQGDDLMLANVEKPLTKAEDFFDFETKYMKGGKSSKRGGGKGAGGSQGYSEVPAKLPGKLYQRSEEIARRVYEAIGCQGIARVDLLIDSKGGLIYFNEVNPMPGGLYAHNFAKSGINNVDLVLKLLEFARRDFEARRVVSSTFESGYLEQF